MATTRIDYFSTTSRGLFLAPAALPRHAQEVSLLAAPLAAGALAVAEVAAVPQGCPVDRLEVLQPLAGSLDACQTLEMPLQIGMRVVVGLGGRFANRSISGRAPAG
ncbi:MAG: hypothetical protein AABZ64_17505, partial [Nitrospinota bacterium]